MGTLSRTSLLGFLDYLANKGLMNKATAAARKGSGEPGSRHLG